jgi:hypothetical protein
MRSAQTQQPVHNTLQVLAAACAAQRINGGYFKAGWQELQGSVLQGSQTVRASEFCNRVLMERCLAQPQDIQDEDHDTAAKIVAWYRGKLFRVLANQRVSEFEHRVMKILEQPECQSRWDFAVLASVPDGYFRAMTVEAAQERMRTAEGGMVAQPGQRVELECEPLQQIYSQKWHTWYVTAVTTLDQVILFSYRERIAQPGQLRIKGTVKSHENNITRLTRVRVLEKS